MRPLDTMNKRVANGFKILEFMKFAIHNDLRIGQFIALVGENNIGADNPNDLMDYLFYVENDKLLEAMESWKEKTFTEKV